MGTPTQEVCTPVTASFQLPISFLPPPDFYLLANPSPNPRADCREQGCHNPGPASRQTSDKRERDMRGCGREECGERPALSTVFTPCVGMAIVPFCTKLPGFRNSTSLSVCCCHSLSGWALNWVLWWASSSWGVRRLWVVFRLQQDIGQ